MKKSISQNILKRISRNWVYKTVFEKMAFNDGYYAETAGRKLRLLAQKGLINRSYDKDGQVIYKKK